MWKPAIVFLSALTLQAAVIQIGPNGFEVTTSVTGPTPIAPAGASYVSTIVVPFYYSYSGSAIDLLHVFVPYNSLAGPYCTGTGVTDRSCDVGFGIGVAVNGVGTGVSFNIDSNDFGGDVGGSLGGVADAVVQGLNIATITTSLFLTGNGIQNLQTPFTASVDFASNYGTVNAVPEPTTFGFALAGIGAVIVWRRRSARNSKTLSAMSLPAPLPQGPDSLDPRLKAPRRRVRNAACKRHQHPEIVLAEGLMALSETTTLERVPTRSTGSAAVLLFSLGSNPG